MHHYTYLALGDSYTIGEAVPLRKSFPYQVVESLRKKAFHFCAPEIIAETGWTTGRLQNALSEATLLGKYDFITVLIGVNNQYSGREVIEYKEQLEEILKKAIELANGKKEQVMVLSIPDYSVTPFAKTMDVEKISREIEVLNSISKALSIQYKLPYVDIAEGFKEAAHDTELLAGDGLHPSAKEYAKWAEKIVEVLSSQRK